MPWRDAGGRLDHQRTAPSAASGSLQNEAGPFRQGILAQLLLDLLELHQEAEVLRVRETPGALSLERVGFCAGRAGGLVQVEGLRCLGAARVRAGCSGLGPSVRLSPASASGGTARTRGPPSPRQATSSRAARAHAFPTRTRSRSESTTVPLRPFEPGETGTLELGAAVSDADLDLSLTNHGLPFDQSLAPVYRPPVGEGVDAPKSMCGVGLHLIRGSAPPRGRHPDFAKRVPHPRLPLREERALLPREIRSPPRGPRAPVELPGPRRHRPSSTPRCTTVNS